MPAVLPAVLTGERVRLKLGEASGKFEDKLHFRVFENGANDLIYVGVNHGMWSNGVFDLTFRGEVIYTGKVPLLVYAGALINMGNVLDRDPKDGLSITRIGGWHK